MMNFGAWAATEGCGISSAPRAAALAPPPVATSKNSVCVVTGWTLETSMPYSRSSYRIARQTIAWAAFVAE